MEAARLEAAEKSQATSFSNPMFNQVAIMTIIMTTTMNVDHHQDHLHEHPQEQLLKSDVVMKIFMIIYNGDDYDPGDMLTM